METLHLFYAVVLVFVVFLSVFGVAPYVRSWLRRYREISKLEQQVDKQWQHRDSIAAHVSWAKERGEAQDAANLTIELRRVDDEIRALHAKIDALKANAVAKPPTAAIAKQNSRTFRKETP